ncbi:MAG: AEC family transporter [Planctomycetota bacterium]|jgi:predicted permease
MEIVNIVLPVFLVIGVGYALARKGFIDSDINAALSKLVFYVAAPALLFRSTAITPLYKAVQVEVLLVAAAVTVVFAIGIYIATARMAPARRGVLTQGTHRSNMVFVGLPVIMNAYGDSVLGPAAVLIGFMVVIYNLLAVLVLTLPHRDRNANASLVWGKTLLEMVKNPLILGSGAGILYSSLGIGLPVVFDRSFELIGRIAMPVALLTVGADLDLKKLKAEIGPASFAALVKLIVYPGVVYIGLSSLGVEGVALQFPVLIMAAPTAVVSYIMALEMKGDGRLAAAIVIATTLGSMLTISGWLVFFLFMG